MGFATIGRTAGKTTVANRSKLNAAPPFPERLDETMFHRKDSFHQLLPAMPQLRQQFLKFAGVGLMSAVGHYGLLIALVQLAQVNPVPASAAGALLGACINYALNYRYTFRSTKQHHESITKFVIVATVGLLLNTLFIWVGVDLLGAHYLLSQIVTTGLVMVWSFLGNRFWTFQEG